MDSGSESDHEDSRQSTEEESDDEREVIQLEEEQNTQIDQNSKRNLADPVTDIKEEIIDEEYTNAKCQHDVNDSECHVDSALKKKINSTMSSTCTNEIIYCHVCQMKYEGRCPEHGSKTHCVNSTSTELNTKSCNLGRNVTGSAETNQVFCKEDANRHMINDICSCTKCRQNSSDGEVWKNNIKHGVEPCSDLVLDSTCIKHGVEPCSDLVLDSTCIKHGVEPCSDLVLDSTCMSEKNVKNRCKRVKKSQALKKKKTCTISQQ